MLTQLSANYSNKPLSHFSYIGKVIVQTQKSLTPRKRTLPEQAENKGLLHHRGRSTIRRRHQSSDAMLRYRQTLPQHTDDGLQNRLADLPR